MTVAVDSIYNDWRIEEVWLEQQAQQKQARTADFSRKASGGRNDWKMQSCDRRRAADRGVLCRCRLRPESRWHSQNLVFRQPGEHVAARGSDRCRVAADDGGVQQPRHVRSARGAEQPRFDRPRSRHWLELERGWQGADLPIAQRCQMA